MKIGAKLIFGFTIIIALIMVSDILTYSNLKKIESEMGYLVERNMEVLQNAQQLQKLIVDAETGKRVFVITGK
jgi:CHASE3 domain sensor protein